MDFRERPVSESNLEVEPEEKKTSGLKKFAQSRLGRSVLTAGAIHAAGLGIATHEYFQQQDFNERVADREKVKDTLFLPATHEELIEHLLHQAEAENIEELVESPELLKKVDIGWYFIAKEFLEKKLSAEDAADAWMNLELKRKVFKKMATISGVAKQDIWQEMMNEIADPKMYVVPPTGYEKNQEDNDYAKGKARISSYLLYGKSNCKGSVRALLSIADTVYSNDKIELQDLKIKDQGHVRLIPLIDNAEYIAEIGTKIEPLDEENKRGSVIIDNAKAAFLREDLELDELNNKFITEKFFPVADVNQDVMNTPIIPVNFDVVSKTEYDDTEGADFRGEDTPKPVITHSGHLEIPDEDDRKRVSTVVSVKIDDLVQQSDEEIAFESAAKKVGGRDWTFITYGPSEEDKFGSLPVEERERIHSEAVANLFSGEANFSTRTSVVLKNENGEEYLSDVLPEQYGDLDQTDLKKAYEDYISSEYGKKHKIKNIYIYDTKHPEEIAQFFADKKYQNVLDNDVSVSIGLPDKKDISFFSSFPDKEYEIEIISEIESFEPFKDKKIKVLRLIFRGSSYSASEKDQLDNLISQFEKMKNIQSMDIYIEDLSADTIQQVLSNEFPSLNFKVGSSNQIEVKHK